MESEKGKADDNKIETGGLFGPPSVAVPQAETLTDGFQCLRCKQVNLLEKKGCV